MNAVIERMNENFERINEVMERMKEGRKGRGKDSRKD